MAIYPGIPAATGGPGNVASGARIAYIQPMSESLVRTLVARSPLLLLAASIAVLGTALASQYLGGLQPCVLCVYQRLPYAAVIMIATAALFLPTGPRAVALALAGLALLTGTGIAVFHVGVEQHWWQGTAECGSVGAADSVEALRAQILSAPVVRCDEVPWSLFGISMAGYNALVSLGLGIASLIAARQLTRDA